MSSTAPAAIVDETDVVYLSHDGQDLLARIYRPAGAPKAALVDVHGGAWTGGDRLNNLAIDRALAAAGFLVAAVDFRLAPGARYPASIADSNFAVRWLKGQAARYGFDAAKVGALGTSSGGHQMLLNAVRPLDPNFASIEPSYPQDASLAFAVAGWPIADPLARYQMAKERNLANLVRNHDSFFGDEATMALGNPQYILDRGEQTHLPPLLILQGTADENVSPDVARRFADSYGKVGGRVALEIFPDQPHAFVTKEFDNIDSRRAMARIVHFVEQQIA
ncbi:MAG TPA: alpha/beta hydrolase [Pseudolabrys sp.]|nr:alpha/beta hydrolase [Pseudolabrys sp.]